MPMHLTSYTAPRRQTGAAALRPVARWSLAAIAGAWLLVAGQAHASVIIQRSLSIGLNNGLVGWWTFDGKDMSGIQAYDRSGNGNTGRYWNATGTPPVIGKIGQALDFLGANAHVDIGHPTSLDLTGDFTYSLWAYLRAYPDPSVNSFPALLSKRDTFAGMDFELFACGSVSNCGGSSVLKELQFWFGGSGAQKLFQGSNVQFSAGAWHHVTLTKNGTTFTLYTEGAPKASAVNATAMPTGDNTRIGLLEQESQGQGFNGLIDDVRIYNRALSPDEIKRLYNMGGTVKLNKTAAALTNGLVGWWTFDGKDISGVQAYDRSGGGNRGILTSGPVQTIGKIGQGLQFDGVDDYVNVGKISSPATAITMSGWVFANHGIAGHQNERIIWKQNQSTNPWMSYDLALSGINGSLNPSASVTVNGTLYNNATQAATITAGVWHHLAGTWQSGDAVRLYIDGVLAETSSAAPSGSITYNSSFNTLIGFNDLDSVYLDGVVDDVRVYNRALSADEIKRLYNIGGTVKLNSTATSLTNGLVGWWTFDGKDMAGNYAFDKSGNGNRGTLTSGPARTIGKIGQALTFDGVSGYVNMGNPTSLKLTGSATWSAWVKINSCPSGQCVIISKRGFAGDRGWEFYANDSVGFDIIAVDSADNTNSADRSTVGTYAGVWTHVVGVYNASALTLDIYINGKNDNSGLGGTVASAQNDSSQNVNIGRRPTDFGYFPGLLDDVRVYNRALSAEEIKRLYNMGR